MILMTSLEIINKLLYFRFLLFSPLLICRIGRMKHDLSDLNTFTTIRKIKNVAIGLQIFPIIIYKNLLIVCTYANRIVSFFFLSEKTKITQK